MILAVDVGTKIVGLAIGDESTRVAVPKGSFKRARGEAEKKIIDLIEEWGCSKVIFGLPLDSDGKRTDQCLDVENFARRMERRTKIVIEFIDEYSSTSDAYERAQYLNKDRKYLKENGVIDALSATIILENYFSKAVNKE